MRKTQGDSKVKHHHILDKGTSQNQKQQNYVYHTCPCSLRSNILSLLAALGAAEHSNNITTCTPSPFLKLYSVSHNCWNAVSQVLSPLHSIFHVPALLIVIFCKIFLQFASFWLLIYHSISLKSLPVVVLGAHTHAWRVVLFCKLRAKWSSLTLFWSLFHLVHLLTYQAGLILTNLVESPVGFPIFHYHGHFQ